MFASTSLTTSTVCKTSETKSGVRGRCLSRTWSRMFSATWVIDPRISNPKNPQVPLMVWMVRKTLAISCSSAGFFSSSTIPQSRTPRFSLLSIRNSRTSSENSMATLPSSPERSSMGPPRLSQPSSLHLSCTAPRGGSTFAVGHIGRIVDRLSGDTKDIKTRPKTGEEYGP